MNTISIFRSRLKSEAVAIFPMLAIVLCIQLGFAQTPSIVLQGATLIHPESGKVEKNMSVLIEGDRISGIAPANRLKIPADATVIPLTGKYILPGLIDAHVHYFQSGGLYTRPDVIDLRELVPYDKHRQALRTMAPELFARYLGAGITTTIDVGGPMTNYDLREQATNLDRAPTLFVTGPLVSTYQPEEFPNDDPPIIKVNNEKEAREIVRKQLPRNPDFIKIWYIVLRGQTAEENLPIIKATIEESHTHGLPVAVHATQLQTARLAVEAGADFLVHSVDNARVDDAFTGLLAAKGTSYIPTLIVSANYDKVLSQHLELSPADFNLAEPHTLGTLFDLQHLSDSEIPGWVQRLMSGPVPPNGRTDSIMAYNLRKLWEAGVNIATGTDAGNIGTLHASSYFAELAAMKRAGLSNADILRASTINGAKVLGKESELGSISEGKIADLLIVDENPIDDLQHLRSVYAVVKSGRVWEAGAIAPDSPEQIAQRQLNAYNAQKIDHFLSYYHPKVEVYQFPDTLRYFGRDEMRSRYSDFFGANPQLHCELVNRMVSGNRVIDQERITGVSSGDSFEAIAIYEIEGGLIRKVFFMSK